MKHTTDRSPAPRSSDRAPEPRPPEPRPAEARGADASEKTRYRVMAPVHREGRDKPFWLRLGTAFENPGKNGTPSITVKLDATPLGGELVLFVDEEREQAE